MTPERLDAAALVADVALIEASREAAAAAAVDIEAILDGKGGESAVSALIRRRLGHLKPLAEGVQPTSKGLR